MLIETDGPITRTAQPGPFVRFQREAAIQSMPIQRPITGILILMVCGRSLACW